MKILHVAETVRGGIATYMRELHPLQVAQFGEGNVHYVIPEDHVTDVKEIEARSITSFRRTGRNVPSLARLWYTTEKVIRRMRPDIIHVHSTFAGVTARLRGAGGAPIVYCPHGWAFARETSSVSRHATAWIERLLQRRASSIVCISANESRLALDAGLAAGNLDVVLSGISPAPRAEGAVRGEWISARTKVLFIGRFDKQKGFDLLISAAAQLADKIEVRMIGSEVVGRKADIALPPNVSTLGWLTGSEIEDQLKQADVVVVPSRWEAFGLVVLEAMRAAKPVVAFNVGALSELVDAPSTGLLCEPVGVEALVAALNAISARDLGTMGQAGRNRFLEQFTSHRMHRELELVYAKVLARAS